MRLANAPGVRLSAERAEPKDHGDSACERPVLRLPPHLSGEIPLHKPGISAGKISIPLHPHRLIDGFAIRPSFALHISVQRGSTGMKTILGAALALSLAAGGALAQNANANPNAAANANANASGAGTNSTTTTTTTATGSAASNAALGATGLGVGTASAGLAALGLAVVVGSGNSSGTTTTTGTGR